MASELSRIETIFNEAVAISAPPQRAEFLDRACAGDPDLRQRVEALLAAHDAAGDVHNLPYTSRVLETSAPFREGPGSSIGRYKLLEQIGEGGFGVVFMAEQQHPVRRKVALKVIKLGMDTKQVIARFEAERQALALMEHENIAKVLDAGATDTGRPYFVMELVRGVPITQYCDKNQLPPRERLELFVQVCRAVQHAHTKGIIHRDIKPNNVLVTLHEGVAVPKVIDFGVAKATGQQLTEKTLFTNFVQMVGTPLYMSPEQAEMTSIDIDTRSDIYSLGVLLYELLTGTTPLYQERLKQAAFDEVRRIIRDEEPPRPSTRLSTMGEQAQLSISAQRKSDPKHLGRVMRGELDWIVMKAMEKQRNRRYETPNGLARDIERYLRDETVEACPPSAAYRFSKFARRNRRVLATAAIVVAALLAGTFVSTWQAIRATRASNAEREMRQHLDVALTAAKESARVAVANATAAQEQGSRANRYFLNAREVFDAMEARLKDPKLLVHPEVASLRKKLLEDLLNCYQKIVQDKKADDPVSVQGRASALRMVGDIERGLGNSAEAEKAYRDAIALREPYVVQHPEKRESYQVLATCYAELGDLLAELHRTAEAQSAYRRSLVLWAGLATDPPSGYGNVVYAGSLKKYHARLFHFLEHSGQSEAARGLCAELLAPFEESAAHSSQDVEQQLRLADALNWGGDLLTDTGRPEEARKLFDRSLGLFAKLPPSTAPSDSYRFAARYLNKAGQLVQRERFSESESACRKAIELDPKFPAAYQILGVALRYQNKFDEAIAAYRKCIALDPAYVSGYTYLAMLLANCPNEKYRDPDQAITLAKKALELNPTPQSTTDSTIILGVAYYRKGEFKAAIAQRNESMKRRDGGQSWEWFILAMSHWKLGEKDAAREWYNKALVWMQKNLPDNRNLIRFRSEAAELLGVNDPQKQHPSSLPYPATYPAGDVGKR